MTYSHKTTRLRTARAIREWRRTHCDQVGACDVSILNGLLIRKLDGEEVEALTKGV